MLSSTSGHPEVLATLRGVSTARLGKIAVMDTPVLSTRRRGEGNTQEDGVARIIAKALDSSLRKNDGCGLRDISACCCYHVREDRGRGQGQACTRREGIDKSHDGL
jgi:hypothetical protein